MPASRVAVKTRRARSRHSRDARGYGHTTTGMHELSTPPPALFPGTWYVAAGFRRLTFLGLLADRISINFRRFVDDVSFRGFEALIIAVAVSQ